MAKKVTKKGRTSETKASKSPELEDDKLYLTSDELHLLELGSVEEKSRKLRRQIDNQQSQILQLEIELRQEKLRTLSHQIRETDRKNDSARAMHKEKVTAMREKYGIGPDDMFGHDPISGEIIIDRKE